MFSPPLMIISLIRPAMRQYPRSSIEPRSPVCSQPSDSAGDRAETLGRPLPQTAVKITDVATGETVPCGTVGEICTRGYLVMAGYLGDPEATAAAIDPDGWLHTGDLGSMDERGYCQIAGRIKEMIIRGGENIYPREIEAVLLSHPGVAEVAVVGVPDRFWGEEVGAVIRRAAGTPAAGTPAAGIPAAGTPAAGGPGPGTAGPGTAGTGAPTEAELAEYCQDRLAAYKTPTRWLFTDSFPLTATGKIRKDVLSERLTLLDIQLRLA